MEHLEQAGVLYRKRHDHAHVLLPEDRATLSQSINKMIRTCLVQQGGVASFIHTPFVNVIKRTVASGRFQGDRAAMGFLNLEKYFLLLSSQPWKREFWLLKMYGGYFCTKVKAHLDCAEEIFFLVGYIKPESADNGTTLVLEHLPDPNKALAVAFDCQVAAVMCRQIGDYYDKMRCVQLDLTDAMNVILSGISNDPVAVSSPPAPLTVGIASTGMYSQLSREGVTANSVAPSYGHPYGNQGLAAGYSNQACSREGLKAGGPPPVSRQKIAAADGMGVGVVMAARAPPDIAGQGKVVGPRNDYMPPISVPAPDADSPDSRVPGLLRTSVVPTIASSLPASKHSYAPSSGYGSVPGSTFGAGSSAYAGSSGYGSASQVSSQHYHAHTYGGGGRSGEHADYSAVTNDAVGSRHTRLLPLSQQNPSPFPYIDEDPGADLATPFPEATHEEHLMESIRTLNVTHGASRSQFPPKMTSASSVVGDRRAPPAPPGTDVPFDDWSWFRNQQAAGGPPAYNTVAGTSNPSPAYNTIVGTGGAGVTSQSQNAPLYLADRIRQSSQPATAVTAMLNSDHVSGMKRHVSALDGRLQRTASGDYPPLSVVGEGRQPTGPLSESVLSRERLAPANLVLDGTSQGRHTDSQPIYHPPPSNPRQDPRFQRHTMTIARSSAQQQTPTFADMATKLDKSAALLARQPLLGGPVLNNLDKVHRDGKALNVHSLPQGSGSRLSPTVVMREKPSGSASNLRASSLVTPRGQTDVSGDEHPRHGARSMDLGSMKWRCRACTMENSSATTICVACSKSRDAPDLQVPAAGESKRVCPVCTLENAPGHVECEACGNRLPQELHTFV